MSKNDTDEQAGVGLALIAGLGFEIGKHIKDALRKPSVIAHRRFIVSAFAMNHTLVFPSPNDSRVWSARIISVWDTLVAAGVTPFTVYLGTSPELVPPSEILYAGITANMQTFSHDDITITPGTFIYINFPTGPVAQEFAALHVKEYDEAEYFGRHRE